MAKPASNPFSVPGTGSGRRAIPADVYLMRWSPIVEMLKAGHTTAEIKREHGICAETVRHIRRFMLDDGWVAPISEKKKKVTPLREPRPPKVGMTKEERLQKYSGVVFWLRAGRTMKQAAKLGGVSLNTVGVVRRALVRDGEIR